VDPETGRSNSSAEFVFLVDEVARLILDDAWTLIRGGARNTAGLIVAQLAHKHGLAPTCALPKSEAREGR
jgi:hypothetical protein